MFFMKRISALLLALVLLMSLAACGGGGAKQSAAPAPASESKAEGAAPAEGTPADSAASEWAPTENVTIIVAYKAGSGTDNTARVLTAYAEKYIGKPVIIENLEGGSGSIGWTALQQAEPDGHTLGFLNLPNFNSSITEGLADYTVDDFTAICNHVTETSVVLVKADSQFNTLEDLVQYAKEHPGELKASTNGKRASNHIGAQMLANTAEFQYVDVPYGGTADQLLALRQGEVDFSVAKVADFASFTSEVKILGVFAADRLPELPDVPTVGEQGYYDKWLGSSRCIAAPAGVSEDVVAFYAKAFEQIMQDPDYLKAAEAAGITTDYQGPLDTAAMVWQQQEFAEDLESAWGA